jgi:hypothetical protein
MSRKSKVPTIDPGPFYPVGTAVRVIRPNVLWQGLCGVVTRLTDDKRHRVRLVSPNGAEFDAEIAGRHLEYEI